MPRKMAPGVMHENPSMDLTVLVTDTRALSMAVESVNASAQMWVMMARKVTNAATRACHEHEGH
jgi:hypothetical protein